MPMATTRRLLVCAVLAAVLALCAGCDAGKVPTQVIKDPVHKKVKEFLDKVKAKDYDGAYAMYDAETREAFPKEKFMELCKDKLDRFGAYYVVERIEKDVETGKATVYQKLSGSYENWNSMPSALFHPVLSLNNGQWELHDPEWVAQRQLKLEQDKQRQERLVKFKDKIAITGWTVKNELIKNEPFLAFSGDIENKSGEEVEFVRLEVRFTGAQGQPEKLCLDREKKKCVDRLHVFPVYINERMEKYSLKPGEKRHFVETIASELPLMWTGQTPFEIYDVGKQGELTQ